MERTFKTQKQWIKKEKINRTTTLFLKFLEIKNHHKLNKMAIVGEGMSSYDKQGLISLLYQESTQIRVWPRQYPQRSFPQPHKKLHGPYKKKITASPSQLSESLCLFLLPWSFTSYLLPSFFQVLLDQRFRYTYRQPGLGFRFSPGQSLWNTAFHVAP